MCQRCLPLLDQLKPSARYPVENYYEPCGLKFDILHELKELLEWHAKQGYNTRPSSNVVEFGLSKSVWQAQSLAEGHGSDLCHYLHMSIDRKWLTNWVPFVE